MLLAKQLATLDVMSRGRVEQVATPSELYAQPSTAFVAEFVGVSSRVPVDRRGDLVVLFGHEVAIRGQSPALDAGPIDALLRPEDVSVSVDASGTGVVQHRSFLGATTRLEIGFADMVVKTDVRSSDAHDFELGTRVALQVAVQNVLVTPRRVPSATV